MALIEYIGKKKSKVDNVAGTGAVWDGPGDVVEIEDPKAVAKLIEHKDAWRVADATDTSSDEADPAAAATPTKATKTKATKKKPVKKVAKKVATKAAKAEEVEPEPAAHVNVEAMNKEALAKHAKRTYNFDVDTSKSEAHIRKQVKAVAEMHAQSDRNVKG